MATHPTTLPAGLASTIPRPLTITDHLSPPAEGHAWWAHRRARAEETTATTGETTLWEEDPIEGVTFTGGGGAEEESRALGAEGEEGPEEGTTTWMVCDLGLGICVK